MSELKFIKVFFDLSGTQWGEITESLNAISINSNECILDNSPFHAYGVSYKDVVKVKERDNRLFFEEVLKRGGHSTLRIFFKVSELDTDFIKKQLQLFVDIGCGYEGDGKRLYAIDVPPEVNLPQVIEMLQEGERIGEWEYEEGYIHPKT